MEINFEYSTEMVTNGVTLLANGVYVGNLLDLPQGGWINWCAIQGEFKCKFALRNEDTFDLVLEEIKRYCLREGKTGIIVSSCSSGGIRNFFSEEFWLMRGFKAKDNASKAFLFLELKM